MRQHDVIAHRIVGIFQSMEKAQEEARFKVESQLLTSFEWLPQYKETLNRVDVLNIYEEPIDISKGWYTPAFLKVFIKICAIYRVQVYCKKLLVGGNIEPSEYIFLIGHRTSVMICRRIGIWLERVEVQADKQISRRLRTKASIKDVHLARWSRHYDFYTYVGKVIDNYLSHHHPERGYSKIILSNSKKTLKRYINLNYPKARLAYSPIKFRDGCFLRISIKTISP